MLNKWKKGIATFGATATILGGGTVTADKMIDPYTDKETTLEISKISELPEAGEIKNIVSKDEPKVTFSKWNGEVALGVKSLDVPSNSKGKRAFLSDKVEWGKPNLIEGIFGGVNDITMEAIPVPVGEGHEDGGMEINLILNSKPTSNVFTFQLDNWENLDFFYQAPLWKEAGLDSPSQECTENDCDSDGIIHRPKNVVGSYAVYHKTKANHRIGDINYATGKVYHIFRPKVFDSNHNEVWAEMSYNNGVLSVVVPKNFIDTATYPIKIDPTFGYTSIGGSGTSNGGARGNVFSTSLYTATTNDVIDYYQDYCSGSVTDNITAYTVSAGGLANRLGSSNTVSCPATLAWTKSTLVSDSLTNGTQYGIAVGGSSSVNRRADTLSGNAYDRQGTDYTLSATWTHVDFTAIQASFYAVYHNKTRTTYASTVVLVSNPGTGNQTWTVPSDFTSTNTIECIGAGGDGYPPTGVAGGGGGGGAYAIITNLSLTPGNSVTYAIGDNATTTSGSMANETYFNGTASSTATISCAFGKTGNFSAGGLGGSDSDSTGTIKIPGGNGCNGGNVASNLGGGGGGGSAGISGTGRTCTNVSTPDASGGGGANGNSSSNGGAGGSSNGGNGGNGTDGTGGGTGGSGAGNSGNDGTSQKGGGGGGGARGSAGVNAGNGGNGSVDTLFDSIHGSSGGGGGGGQGVGASSNGGNGGNGGTYGGGGGGGGTGTSGGAIGSGGQGIIVITYTPLNTSFPYLQLQGWVDVMAQFGI